LRRLRDEYAQRRDQHAGQQPTDPTPHNHSRDQSSDAHSFPLKSPQVRLIDPVGIARCGQAVTSRQ
jgi:hypothetical protein